MTSQVMNVQIGGDGADVRLLDRDEPQALRREPDQRRQVAMFAASLTGPLERVRPHHMLREVWGWTPDDYQNWLRETLTRTLLPD
jgi:hypothetical protein